MLPSILMRADGSPSMGLGHAMRLLALAQSFIDCGGRVHLAFSQLPNAVLERFAAEGIALHRLDALPGSHEDARAAGALAAAIGARWAIIDGYHFSDQYRAIVKDAGVSLVVIDDLARGTFRHADVVVNPNVCAETYRYACASSTRLLLGPRYVLLRREFQSLRRARNFISSPVRRVLVTFGGSDPSNTTALVLEALRTMPLPEVTIDAVVGGANRHMQQLQRLADVSGDRVRLLYNVRDMAGVMAHADLALAAASTTALELAFMGVPSILCAIADNQESSLHAFESLGAALSIGRATSLSVDAVQTAVTQLIGDAELRRSLATRAQAMVDGRGARRVLQAMVSEIQGPLSTE